MIPVVAGGVLSVHAAYIDCHYRIVYYKNDKRRILDFRDALDIFDSLCENFECIDDISTVQHLILLAFEQLGGWDSFFHDFDKNVYCKNHDCSSDRKQLPDWQYDFYTSVGV